MQNKRIFNEDLLCTTLSENNIYINEIRLVSLDDINKKIIKSKKKADIDKILIDGKYYITLDTCHELLYDLNSKLLLKNNFDNVIDIEKNILQYNEYQFTSFFIINGPKKFDVWIRYSEILDLLNLNDDDDVKKENMNTYEKISMHNKFPKNNNTCKYKYSRFINLGGILLLLPKSMAVDIDELIKFFEYDITQSFHRYMQRTTDQFFHCGEILCVDFGSHGIMRKEDFVDESDESE